MTITQVLKNHKPAAIFVSLFLVSMLLAPLIFDNVDRNPWYEPVQEGYSLRVNSKRTLTEQEVKEDDRMKLTSIKDVLGATSNVCLGGQDPSRMTTQEHIEAFNAGPCNPVVLIPGLAGTSLQVKVDCEKLSRARPDIFKGCGWSTCSAYQLFNKRPDAEYRIWISSVTSPVGIIMASKKTSCFGDVIQLVYDHTQPDIVKRYTDIEGIKVTYYGNTPNTLRENDCGLSAIGELTDDRFIKLLSCEHRGFTNLVALFKGMGYISGLTVQAIPYDYRRSIVSSNIPQVIVSSVENLKKITGKKVTDISISINQVVILTHSLGSLYALHTLAWRTQAWKDANIASLMTVGGPFLGSTKVVRSTLGGDPGYLDKFLGQDLGINYYCQNLAINSQSSTIDIYPKDTYFKFKNAPWMQELQQRIKYEEAYLLNKTDDKTTVPMDWFPSPKEKCTIGFKERPDNCLTLLSDMTKPFLHIGQDSFTSEKENILDIFERYSINGTKLSQYYHESEVGGYSNFDHPGVPTIIVYGAFLPVEESFSYELNPRVEIESKNDFYFPKVSTFAYGDGTVMASSAMTPAIKWINEHKNKKISKPTKLVEICSNYKPEALFDTVNDGTKSFTTSGYKGLPCECLNTKDYSTCRHSCMINDKNLLKLAAELVQTNEKSIHSKSPLTNSELEDFRNQCQNLRIDL